MPVVRATYSWVADYNRILYNKALRPLARARPSGRIGRSEGRAAPSYQRGILWCRISHKCQRLSNSGEALKPIIPSSYVKSGWSNDSCMVTNYGMNENEMGNRGSKSIVLPSVIGTDQKNNDGFIEKEQRVDGSRHNKRLCLRCTLLNFEKSSALGLYSSKIRYSYSLNYKIWVLPGQKYRYSTSGVTLSVPIRAFHSIGNGFNTTVTSNHLDPWFVTGFTDGEGCFRIKLIKNGTHKLGSYVSPVFQITLHKKDLNLLQELKSFWGVGNITVSKESCQYSVNPINDIVKIINHFNSYPLITKKQVDFQLFQYAVTLIMNKKHLTLEGLKEIEKIKDSMNRGPLAAEAEGLKLASFNLTSKARASAAVSIIKDPNWLAGFTSAEGCFYLDLYKSESSKLKAKVRLKLIITQHDRDEQLIRYLIDYLGCGNFYKAGNAARFIVTNFKDIDKKILPFFTKYLIKGNKSQDFQDFCQAVEIIKNKEHLTVEGLNKIRVIKEGMNLGRSNSL